VEADRGKTSSEGAWKIPLLMVIFFVTLAPYVVVAMFAGLLDLISFFVAWVLFFVMRANLAERVSFVGSLVCGVMLAFPLSAFMTVLSSGAVLFHFGYGFETGDNPTGRLLFFLLLMSAAHYLAGSIKWISE
jgi:hypothetical protein